MKIETEQFIVDRINGQYDESDILNTSRMRRKQISAGVGWVAKARPYLPLHQPKRSHLPAFDKITQPDPLQQRALDLLHIRF